MASQATRITPMIEFRNVTKIYDLRPPFEIRRLIERRAPPERTRVAVDNLSMTVRRGERVGVIGRNGAGKTTLLRMLAGVTLPTRGRVRVTGNVASLISLGMGFHPDLSGRENVHLFCALMGYSGRDLITRVGEILEFADIPGSEDIAFKRYSSGMMARVGFSAAVHVTPDILLLDEVLAVGDHTFQARSLDRVLHLARSCTVVYVSHDLDSMKDLTDRVIWLDKGRMRADGTPDAVVAAYLDDQNSLASESAG